MLIIFLIHLQLDFLPVIFGVVFSWNVFLAYHSSFKETIHKLGWKIALLCLFWIVWKKREEMNLSRLGDLILVIENQFLNYLFL